MTEEIKYNKDEKWISYKQLAETPQQTIARLEQENKANLKQIELDVEHICNLNKRINELEQENRELKAYKDVNEDFKKAWDELNRKYTEVLKLAKENADSNEYCLQELEKKNFALTQESQQKSQTICELEQENKELKKKLELDEVQLKSYFIGEEKICKENNTYRSALEEIRTYLNTLSIIDSDFPNTETYLRIENKIEEVIG